jgi:hypothetical protein
MLVFPLLQRAEGGAKGDIQNDYQTFVGVGRFARSFWTGWVREMRILLLAGRSEDLAHDEDIELIGVASGFVFEGLEDGRGEGAFAGEE